MVIHLSATELRQDGVEQDQVDLVRPTIENLHGFLAIGGGDDAVAKLGQHFHNELADALLILDDQNGGRTSLVRHDFCWTGWFGLARGSREVDPELRAGAGFA